MRSISNIWDVLDWGLCIGCGACAYACDRNAATLKNIEAIGIWPFFERQACRGCTQCLEFCPGYRVVIGTVERAQPNEESYHLLIGSAIEIWEGAATDEKMRFSASSGGALSALALYCIEKENMEFVLHTGMNPQRPWENITVLSHGREELLQHTGSRYAASSPCDGLRQIEESGRPCVFVGKPCDVAAVSALRRLNPQLGEKLGLVLSFFCAGTPSAKATIDLMHQQGVVQENVKSLRYRGEGWPGWFTVTDRDDKTKSFCLIVIVGISFRSTDPLGVSCVQMVWANYLIFHVEMHGIDF